MNLHGSLSCTRDFFTLHFEADKNIKKTTMPASIMKVAVPIPGKAICDDLRPFP